MNQLNSVIHQPFVTVDNFITRESPATENGSRNGWHLSARTHLMAPTLAPSRQWLLAGKGILAEPALEPLTKKPAACPAIEIKNLNDEGRGDPSRVYLSFFPEAAKPAGDLEFRWFYDKGPPIRVPRGEITTDITDKKEMPENKDGIISPGSLLGREEVLDLGLEVENPVAITIRLEVAFQGITCGQAQSVITIEPPNARPTARILVESKNDREITFNGRQSVDADNDLPLRCSWQILESPPLLESVQMDPAILRLRMNPVDSPQRVTVTLTVEDSRGARGTNTLSVTMEPPLVALTVPEEGEGIPLVPAWCEHHPWICGGGAGVIILGAAAVAVGLALSGGDKDDPTGGMNTPPTMRDPNGNHPGTTTFGE